MAKVENFQLDHTIVKAPYVRVAGIEHDPEEIASALERTLKHVLETTRVPAVSALELT